MHIIIRWKHCHARGSDLNAHVQCHVKKRVCFPDVDHLRGASAALAYELEFYGYQTDTEVPGYPGYEAIMEVFEAEERNYDGDELKPTMYATGLKGFYWKEGSGKPCYIRFYQADLMKKDKKDFDYLELDICRGSE